jgi:hypothetical protein
MFAAEQTSNWVASAGGVSRFVAIGATRPHRWCSSRRLRTRCVRFRRCAWRDRRSRCDWNGRARRSNCNRIGRRSVGSGERGGERWDRGILLRGRQCRGWRWVRHRCLGDRGCIRRRSRCLLIRLSERRRRASLNPLHNRVPADADEEGRQGRANVESPPRRDSPIDRQDRQPAAYRQKQTGSALKSRYC